MPMGSLGRLRLTLCYRYETSPNVASCEIVSAVDELASISRYCNTAVSVVAITFDTVVRPHNF